jgi:fatty-acyl-CoA synthase
MMDSQLTTWLLFSHAADHFAEGSVVTRQSDGSIHHTTYELVSRRAHQLMHALDALGIRPGEAVATLAWNSYRHLEAYFGIPCSGRVLHTLNLRLSPDDLAYIINHAGDAALLVDPDLIPLLEKISDRIPSVRRFVVLGATVPDTSLPGVIGYEDLIADQPHHYEAPDIDERSVMGLCYTSGTTGRPKGVAYTHRSTFLHALAVSSMAGMAIGPGDSVLPVVPMFHAAAWGMPHASTAVGAKQVFFAGPLVASDLVDLLLRESVTVTAGVPTVWASVAEVLAARSMTLPSIRHIISGGSQPPPALIDRYLADFGIKIVQAWGMTETSPLASAAWPQERMRGWTAQQLRDAVWNRAGVPLPGIDVCLRSAEGARVPFDGESMGDLCVRGPWVADAYENGEGTESFTEDGWFLTGDVAVGSPDGYFVIADRTKDLIKSGGEWISSVDMEAAIMAMAAVAEAAVVAVPDPKWQERPLPCIVLRHAESITLAEVRAHLLERGFANWQLPDRIELIEEVPKTAVGKFDKKVLRVRFPS